jgi:hypothetical protein
MVTPPTTTRIEIPAVIATVKKTMYTNETKRAEDIVPISKTFSKRVMSTTTIAVAILSQSKTLKIKKLVSDASVSKTDIAGNSRTVSKEVLLSKGGLTTWKEVECALVEYPALPINWN